MSDESPNSDSCCGGVPVIRVALGAVLLLGVVWFFYAKHRPAGLGDGVHTVEQREATLKKLRQREAAAATSYAWLDKEKGVVCLPLDRAVELTIQDLNAAKK
jgi:hypothetical protein